MNSTMLPSPTESTNLHGTVSMRTSIDRCTDGGNIEDDCVYSMESGISSSFSYGSLCNKNKDMAGITEVSSNKNNNESSESTTNTVMTLPTAVGTNSLSSGTLSTLDTNGLNEQRNHPQETHDSSGCELLHNTYDTLGTTTTAITDHNQLPNKSLSSSSTTDSMASSSSGSKGGIYIEVVEDVSSNSNSANNNNIIVKKHSSSCTSLTSSSSSSTSSSSSKEDKRNNNKNINGGTTINNATNEKVQKHNHYKNSKHYCCNWKRRLLDHPIVQTYPTILKPMVVSGIRNYKVFLSFALWFITYLIMGILGGTVAYMHFPRTTLPYPNALPDFGYDIIPEWCPAIPYVPHGNVQSTVLMTLYTMLIIGVIIRWNNTKGKYQKVDCNNCDYVGSDGRLILQQLFHLNILVFITRTTTVGITGLPQPNPRCTPVQVLPVNYRQAFAFVMGRGFPPHACGDLIYSGHVACTLVCMIILHKHGYLRLLWARLLVWMLATLGFFATVSCRSHYTVDCILACYFAFFLREYYYARSEGLVDGTVARWIRWLEREVDVFDDDDDICENDESVVGKISNEEEGVMFMDLSDEESTTMMVVAMEGSSSPKSFRKPELERNEKRGWRYEDSGKWGKTSFER